MEPSKPGQIRGKDLAGAIKVMPMGMDAAIKKRVSGEFKSEQRGATVSFSNVEQNSSLKREMKQQLTSFSEEKADEVRSVGTPFQQAGFQAAPLQENSSLFNQKQENSISSSIVNNQQNSFSSQQQMSSSSSVQKSQQITSQSSSSSSKSFSSMQSSNMVQKEFAMAASTGAVTFAPTAIEPQPIEIGQDNLKTQLVSCISDLEKDRDFVDFNKENKPINLASPPQTFSPVPTFEQAPKQDTFSPGPQTKQDMFSPPPLEAMEPPKASVDPIQHPSVPSRNEFIQNGFSDFAATGASKENVEIQRQQFESNSFQQQSMISTTATQQVLNSSFEESGSVQGSSSSSSLLQKIMTPANNEYDTGSLKRRDPRKMFTDSSFYSAKHHPTVADQVEMAHKLSSAMFNEKNKSTKGQQMFLSRVQNAGEEEVGDPNKMPNLKHVMNPEGRMTEWEDVTKEDLPNAEMMAAHAAPIPNTPDPIAESLLAEAGKGELPRPSTFVSAYRRVFEQNRTVFGIVQQDTSLRGKSCESPRLEQKGGSQDMGHKAAAGPKPVQPTKNIPSTIASPNLNKNRVTAPKSVTIVDAKTSKDSIGRLGGKDTAMVEMKPVTVRIKDPSEPSASPRKGHHHNHLASPRLTAKQVDNRKTVAPPPLNPTVPHFIENQKQPLDNQKFATKALDNRVAPPSAELQVLDNGHSVRRHASFNEKMDNRPTRTVWENNLNQMTRPGDVLRTPFLLSSSSRTLNQHQSNQNVVGNFPHIPGTSMVAKTKALFEGGGGPTNFAPLTKSRTFSSFPTNRMEGPGTPSVPARKSSRKVFEDYKSMNDCGNDSTPSSPMTQRRIPMANFF